MFYMNRWTSHIAFLDISCFFAHMYNTVSRTQRKTIIDHILKKTLLWHMNRLDQKYVDFENKSYGRKVNCLI